LVVVLASAMQPLLAATPPAGAGVSEPKIPAPGGYATGITLVGRGGCPLVVWAVAGESPADLAGIRAGDHLIEVEGQRLRGDDLDLAARLLRAERPEAVNLRLERRGSEYTATLVRESIEAILGRAAKKLVGGFVFPVNASPAEIARERRFDDTRITDEPSRITTRRILPDTAPPSRCSSYVSPRRSWLAG
jgi:hypothetical protein